MSKFLRRMHFWAGWVWVCLVIPSVWVWRSSLPWITFMSIYAIIVSHFSAYQAARAECAASPEV